MRKLTTLMYFFMAAALFLTSCGGDDEEDPTVQKPTVALASTSAIKGDATVSATQQLVFKLDLREGGAKLKTFTIRQATGSATPVAPNTNVYTIVDLDGKTVKTDASGNYDINSNSVYTVTFNALGSNGIYSFVFGLTDKDGVSADPLEVTITVKSTTEQNVPKLYSQNGAGDDALAVGSFYSTTKNSTYATASASANLASLDFALNEPTNGAYKLVRPQGQATSNTTITSSTAAKTMFSTTLLEYDTVTASELAAATASETSIAIADGATYFYSNSNTGVKGLIKITSIDTVNDRISFTLKFIVE